MSEYITRRDMIKQCSYTLGAILFGGWLGSLEASQEEEQKGEPVLNVIQDRIDDFGYVGKPFRYVASFLSQGSGPVENLQVAYILGSAFTTQEKPTCNQSVNHHFFDKYTWSKEYNPKTQCLDARDEKKGDEQLIHVIEVDPLPALPPINEKKREEMVTARSLSTEYWQQMWEYAFSERGVYMAGLTLVPQEKGCHLLEMRVAARGWHTWIKKQIGVRVF